jgi:hypothetical protein
MFHVVEMPLERISYILCFQKIDLDEVEEVMFKIRDGTTNSYSAFWTS